MTPLKEKKPRAPRNKPAGLALLAVSVLVLAVVYLQFRGDLTAKTTLTMLSSRAGLVMNPGSKVTFNGVQIGRVDAISEIAQDGQPAARPRPYRLTSRASLAAPKSKSSGATSVGART